MSQLSIEDQIAKAEADHKANIEGLKAKAKLQKDSEAALKPAFETLTKYAEFISDEQKKQVASIFGLTPKAATKRATKRAGSGAPAEQKFQIPSGQTWSGRGRRAPNEFLEWSASPEGKKWHKENPDQKYPPISK